MDLPRMDDAKAVLSALIVAAAASLAIGIALFELTRRWLESRAADPPLPGPVMVPAAAAAIVFSALALLLVRSPHVPAARYGGRFLAMAVLTLGFLVVWQYASSWWGNADYGMLIAYSEWWAPRPGVTTGLALIFLGASILALSSARRHVSRWGSIGAAATLVVTLSGLVGHAYGATTLYGLSVWGGMAISTALVLSAIALGALFAHPARGVAVIFLSASSGGYLLRQLVPAVILAPLLLGWLALKAQESELVDAVYATALLVVALIVLPCVLVLRLAKAMHDFDLERERLLKRQQEAREQVTGILESITDAFFHVDKEWCFTYVNREAERLLRRNREALVGRNLWAEFPAAVGAVFQQEYHRAMDTQQTVQFEARYPPLGIWFEVRAYPAADGLSVYFRDVTERKRAEKRLQESEERYRLLADMVPQHIWTTDPDGYHNYFSRRWYEYTGATPEQTRGKGWLTLLHPDDRERTVVRWRHSVRTGEPYAIEYRFRGADGTYCWFLGQAEPLRNEAGEIIRWFGTLTDISERKRLEEERERLLRKEQDARAEAERRQAELERVTESRARLIRGFSHDLRNALQPADIQAFMLEDGRAMGELAGKQRESLQSIRRSISASIQLIDDMLELARAEEGQLDIKPVPTDIGHQARDVVEDFRAQANAAGRPLELRVAEELLADTDPARLRQILTNLLSNALKYAPQGQITVDAQTRQSGGPGPGNWIAVEVADEGPGIPQDKHEEIFHEYSRLHPEVAQGSGIGLAISRRIARLLGGDITVQSKVGRGSAFTLWLPRTE